MAKEAIDWANRQILAAERRLKTPQNASPRAHHVALLALVELAHEALMERNKTADSLNHLILRLEKLKQLKSQGHIAPDLTKPAAAPTVSEEQWLSDQPVDSGSSLTV